MLVVRNEAIILHKIGQCEEWALIPGLILCDCQHLWGLENLQDKRGASWSEEPVFYT